MLGLYLRKRVVTIAYSDRILPLDKQLGFMLINMTSMKIERKAYKTIVLMIVENDTKMDERY